MMDYRAGKPPHARLGERLSDWFWTAAFVLVLLVTPARSQNYNERGISLFDITNSAQTVKGSAGTWTGYECFNPNATTAWVQFFNSLTATVGTTTAMASVSVPALTSTGRQPASPAAQYVNGVPFTTGLQTSATTTATGTTAPTSPLACTLFFR